MAHPDPYQHGRQPPGYGYPAPPTGPPPARPSGLTTTGKIVLGVVAGAVGLSVIGGIVHAVSRPDRVPVAAATPSLVAPIVPTGDPYDALGGPDVALSGAPGDTLEGNGLAVTASGLTDGDSTFGPTVCTTVTYTNAGPDTVVFSMLDWSLVDANGVVAQSSFFGADVPLSSGELEVGGTTGGAVCFDRPATAGGGTIVYEPLLVFSDDRRTWATG